MNDLRNISCTALFSKVYGGFVLGWQGEQVGMRANQLGGMKSAGTEHYLVQLFQLVLESLEDPILYRRTRARIKKKDPRAASVIASIEYAKAFNHLDFLHCLQALADKGSSSELIAIVSSFLTSRKMLVKVGQALSKPRVLLGGVPQGSILGVFLFNTAIDTFEAGSDDVEHYGIIGGTGGGDSLPYPPNDRSLNQRIPKNYDSPGFKAWESIALSFLKYIDDNILHEKLCMDGLVIDKHGRKRA